MLGNALQFDRPRMHQQVERWVREYGPYFSFRIGRRRIFVVADHAAMGALLRDRPDGFRRTKRLAEITAEIGSAAVGVFSAEGEVWKRQRRMVMAGFDPRHLRAYFPSLVKVSERLAGRWERAADAGTPIDLQGDLMRYTVDTVSGLAFGAEVNTLESDDDVIQRHLDKIFPAIFRRIMAALPTWRWWKSAADRELDESVAAIGVAIRDFIAAARARLEDPERRAAPQNLLEAMIVAADDPQSGITPGEIQGNVLTMLLAGEDTTANTLAWAIWLLAQASGLLRARACRGRRAARRSGSVDDRAFRRPRLCRGMRERDAARQAGRSVPHAAGVARDERRRHPHPGRHGDLGRVARATACARSTSASRKASSPNAGSPKQRTARARRIASRCRSEPVRASARAATWRCSRSRWRSRSCSGGSRSTASCRRAGARNPVRSSPSRCRPSR